MLSTQTKKSRLRLVLAALFAGLLLAVCLTQLGPKEPVVQGKPLSFWLDQYRANLITGDDAEKIALHDEAKRSVRQIGSNAIPHLLMMLRETDSAVATKWRALVSKQRVVRLHSKPAWVWNNEATLGFEILGADAKGAVPALVEIYEQKLSESSQSSAASALGAIGPDASVAVPVLLREAAISNSPVRVSAIWALGQIHSDPGTVVPTLIQCIGDGNRGIRSIAMRALGCFGSNAQQAVPALTALLQDPDQRVSRSAEQAIKQIAP
jgi:HEAT repeat protein